MIDAHVHLEKGPYNMEWLNEFVKVAQKNNISELYILEHTHIFKEFNSLYDEMSQYNDYQKNWFKKKAQKARPIQDYIDYISKMKKINWPIKIKFGLEVCYSPEHEEEIKSLKNKLNLDFMVGSIHFIDGWAFSHLKQKWCAEDVHLDELYLRYYDLMISLCESGIFDGLAHPNSLQCFGAFPPRDYSEVYKVIAKSLYNNNMYVEESSGLKINYKGMPLGMNKEMLKKMKDAKVKILTASDAHLPKDVGAYINEMTNIIA